MRQPPPQTRRHFRACPQATLPFRPWYNPLPRHAQGKTQGNGIQHQPRIRHYRSRTHSRQSRIAGREQDKERFVPLYPLSVLSFCNAAGYTPQAAPSDSELFSENTRSSKRINVIKAAVVLPFLPDGASKSESAKMVEYYEGFLMAVDSLKRTGTSIDLYTYSTGPATSS